MSKSKDDLTIILVGASGHLARGKIMPALFALFCQGYLPETFHVIGFARSEFTDEQFRDDVRQKLTCRYAPGESCDDLMHQFLGRCRYVQGQYESADDFLRVFDVMNELDAGMEANRFFYLAVPPSIFLDVTRAIGDAGLVSCAAGGPWSRVVVEKPFGKDRESSDSLTRELANVFTEQQTYRIDHYLGKEAIQNLMVLRFANLIFEPVWNREFIDLVHINWKENLGVEGRGYFDEYGIVRDVMQNHLLQILSLVAMERPASSGGKDVRNEKCRLLRSVRPVTRDQMVVGQYTAGTGKNRPHVGYRDEKTVPSDSVTATYAAAVLDIDNARWRGVPFVMTAGKGMDEKLGEVRIRFRKIPQNIFCCPAPELTRNELVVRIQPKEALTLNVVSKKPGLRIALVDSSLDLRYETAFESEIPDAYEALLLDIMRGDKGLFIRKDELAAAWDIFTPVLHEMDRIGDAPFFYPFGTSFPAPAEEMIRGFVEP